jgi:exosortase/archaeosortase family protein
MKNKEVVDLIARYGILVLLGIGNLWLFYKIFTPLTVFPVYWALNLIYGAQLIGSNMVLFNGITADIIPACIAGAAYYLLLILNLTTPIKIGKRLKSILFLFGVFLGLNLVRLIVFAVLYSNGFEYFDFLHEFTWYVGSTIMVVSIWFLNVWIFKINEIPVFSDAKKIIKSIKTKK